MNENEKQKNLVDATDCLEAIGVFKSWKNLFFIITLLSILLIQASFWAADLDLTKQTQASEQKPAEAIVQQAAQTASEQNPQKSEEIQEAVTKVAQDVNAPAAEKQTKKTVDLSQVLKPVHILWTIRSADFIILISSVLYCLTILFSLKVSLIGRLGGINHISRAFFISLVMVVFLMPWQQFFGWFMTGAVFEPSELTAALKDYPDMSLFERTSYYLRFVGYWVIILLLLIAAQARTCRWARATLKRLEVI